MTYSPKTNLWILHWPSSFQTRNPMFTDKTTMLLATKYKDTILLRVCLIYDLWM